MGQPSASALGYWRGGEISATVGCRRESKVAARERELAFAVDDPALGQIVRREFDANSIARHDADEVLTHSSRDVGHDNVSTFDLHAEPRVREGLGNGTLDLKSFFLLFRHKKLAWGIDRGDCPLQPKIVAARTALIL